MTWQSEGSYTWSYDLSAPYIYPPCCFSHSVFLLLTSLCSGIVMYTQSIYAFFLALYIHIWSANAETLCYNPDGNVPSPPYFPCNSIAEGVHSACCYTGDACSTLGYCFNFGGFIYRGGHGSDLDFGAMLSAMQR